MNEDEEVQVAEKNDSPEGITNQVGDLAKQKANQEIRKVEQKVADKTKKVAKDATKKVAKKTGEMAVKLGGKILALLAPYLPFIIGAVFILFIIIAFFGSITDILDNVKKALSETIDSIVSLFSIDGNKYTISDDEVDKLMKELEEDGISIEDLGISKSEFKTFLEANMITQTVEGYLVGDKKGAIQVWVTSPDDTSEELTGSKKLSFIDYESFQKKISEEDESCLSYYTVDSLNNIIVATKNIRIEREGGNIKSEKIEYSTKSFGYKTVTSQYNMPIMFFVDMAVMTGNKDYVLTLAEQTKNSEIIITMQNSRTITDSETTETHTSTYINDDGEEVEDTSETTIKVQNISDTLTPVVTKVDTLLFTKEMKYTNKSTTETTNSATVTKNIYNPGIEVAPYIKVEEFEKTAKDKEAYSSLISGGEMLFQIMDKNIGNETLVQILKYILYQISNQDFGVTEVPNMTSQNDFSSVGSFQGSSIAEKIWFALKGLNYSDIAIAGALGNLHYESGGINPLKVEGGYNEDNGGIGIAQWTNNKRGTTGRNANLKAYAASKGTTWRDEDTQIEFLIGELTKGGGANGYASYELLTTSDKYDGIKHSPSEWINATDVETATRIFCYSFERPNYDDARKSMPTRIKYAQIYYEQFRLKVNNQGGNAEDYSKVEKYRVGGYEFPLYNQGNYAYRQYGKKPGKTIKTSGCVPASMSMIVAGLTRDKSVNPDSYVTALEHYFPDSDAYYVYDGGSRWEGVSNSGFLQKNYGLKSIQNPTIEQGYAALEQGKCILGRVPRHAVAVLPVTDEMKAKGYRFFVLDPNGGRLNGFYRDVNEMIAACARTGRNPPEPLTFKAIIEPM